MTASASASASATSSIVSAGDRRAVALAACKASADHMYDAEVGLHIARQTGVDAWISAAYGTLHDAIAAHTESVRAVAADALPAPRARYRTGTLGTFTSRTA